VWHSRDLLTRLARGVPGDPRSFTVVGAGQSAAEVTAHLHERFPQAEVQAVFSRYGYSPADDSPFANRIFDPAAVDVYYQAPPNVKQLLLDYHANTNYSVVDQELIEELYRRAYREKVTGRQRLRIRGASRVRELHSDADGVSVVVEDLASGRRSTHRSDVVVCATGYRQMDPSALLGPLDDQCKRDDQGRLRVDRDYRVVTTGDARWGVYLQGGTEHTHGISSSLLSNTAVRAGEIADALVQQVSAHRLGV
jgi:L-ornithine N5-oxygenase